MRHERGNLLRQLRQRQGLTLHALSQKVGVSQSALSQFETGKSEPSLGTLWRLGRALEVSLFDFFARQEAGSVDVVPASQRIVVAFDRFRYEAVARSHRRRLDLYFLHLQPGDGPVREPTAHVGEECGVVLSGCMDVIVNDEARRLRAGDSIWFLSGQPHTFAVVGDTECVSLWADTLPEHTPDHLEVESLFDRPEPDLSAVGGQQ